MQWITQLPEPLLMAMGLILSLLIIGTICSEQVAHRLLRLLAAFQSLIQGTCPSCGSTLRRRSRRIRRG